MFLAALGWMDGKIAVKIANLFIQRPMFSWLNTSSMVWFCERRCRCAYDCDPTNPTRSAWISPDLSWG